MRNLVVVSFLILIFAFLIFQHDLPDLSNKNDLKSLGTGRIIETDKSIITSITLYEVSDYFIVYVKEESLHDMMMDKIDRIEFRNTKWGPITIRFPENKPQIIKRQ